MSARPNSMRGGPPRRPPEPPQIVLVDARCDSLTITWPPMQEVVFYLLEYRSMVDNEFELLADDLTLTEIRKTALESGVEYIFRVAAIYDDDTISDWITHEEPFSPLTVEEDEDFSMAAPVVTQLNEPETLLIQWETIDEDIYGFEIQLRQNRGGKPWQTIADDIRGNQVKKRNLKCKWGYQFRIRPVTDHGSEPFSPPSSAVVAKGAPSPFPAILLKGMAGKQQQQSAPPPPQPRQRPAPGRNPREPQPHFEERGPMPPEGGDPYYEDEQGEDGEYYEGEEEALWVMDAPWFKNADEQNALFVCWKPFPDATGYELQMMKCMKKHPKWVTLAPNLQGCEVKKKNLTSKNGYQFRVRPNGFEEELEFSEPSNPAFAN